MSDRSNEISWDDELVDRLAAAEDVGERPVGETAADEAGHDDATVEDARAELETVVDALRKPAPDDPFADESACERAVGALLEMGRDPSFSTREQMAEVASGDLERRQLGQYQLLEKLGAGGMGTVYKAVHDRLEKVVALKVLPADKLDDEQALQRFDREMRAVGKLQHPNIVVAFDAGEVDDVHYLVMELVEGADLSAIVRDRGPLPVAEACDVVRQAALGLQHAHEYGMVHRDVKPSNLMLTTDGTVKVLDLGLALLADHHETTAGGELTTTGQLMGTLDYMAPEQGVDTHAVDIRADVYSLGATLYKLLTGEAPFSGKRFDSPIKKLRALAVEDVPRVEERRENLPPGLADVVHRMLAKEPADRFPDPAAVAAALEPFTANADPRTLLDVRDAEATAIDVASTPLDGSATKLHAPSTADFDPYEPTVTNAASAATHQVRPAKPPRHRRLWSLAAAVLLLAAVGYWAATVFFVQTEHGVIRVEITGANADEVDVRIKGTTIELTGTDQKSVTVEPGEKALTITRGDFTFDTDSIVLKPGEDVTVRIDFRPGKVVVARADSGVEIGSELLVEPNDTVDPPATKHVALSFDGEDDFVEIPSLRYEGGHPVTIEAWVRIPQPEVDNSVHFVLFTNRFGLVANLDATPGSSRFAAKSYAGSPTHIVNEMHPFGFRAGLWSHVAAVFDASEVRMYRDGERVPQFDHDQEWTGLPPASKPQEFTLLARAPLSQEKYFAGELAELRISRVARYDGSFDPPGRLPADDETLALYHFDEGDGDVLKDASGNGHDGTITGATWVRTNDPSPPSQPLPGRFALEFDGEEDRVELPLMYDGKHPLTIETWISVRRPTGDEQQLASTTHWGGVGLMLGRDASPKLLVHGATDYTGARAEVLLRYKRVVHLAGVFDGTFLRLYRDGRLEVPPVRLDGEHRISSMPFCIGANPDDEGEFRQFFTGRMSVLRISNVARYDEDFVPATRHEPDEHTLALYHFDEGKGDVLRDSSGNGHHGEIVGAKWVEVDDASDSPPARMARALEFDGEGDRVELPSIELDWNLTPLTFEAWVTPSMAREPKLPNVMRIGPFKLRLHRDGPQWMLIAYGNDLQGDDQTVLIGDRVPARLGERTHLAGVFDGNGVKLYVDGQLRDEAKLPRGFQLVDNDDEHFLGAWDAVDENVFQGRMHAARVTKGVRYTENFDPADRFEPDADTLALYRFDEGRGDVLKDSSGNGHHGKIVGARWVDIGTDGESTTHLAREPRLERQLSGHTAPLRAIVFSPNGRFLYSGGYDTTVRMWDVAEGKEVARFEEPGDAIAGLALDATGTRLAVSSYDGRACVLETRTTGEAPRLGPVLVRCDPESREAVKFVDLSKDGKLLLTADKSNAVVLWDVSTGEPRHRVTDHVGDVGEVDFLPDDRHYTTCDDEGIRVRDVRSGRIVRILSGRRRAVATSDGRLLVSGSQTPGQILVQPVDGVGEMRTFGRFDGWVRSLSMPSSNDRLLASGLHDGTFRVWDVTNGTELVNVSLDDWSGTEVAFDPTGTILATAGGYSPDSDEDPRAVSERSFEIRLWRIRPPTNGSNEDVERQ